MDREEIVAELKRVAALLGKNTISRSEFKRHARISSWMIERRFGTWNNALKAAGLVPMDRFKRIADSELKEELQRVYNKLGTVPIRKAFAMASKFSPGVYEKRFGTWNNAVNAAGLVPMRFWRIADSELQEEFQRVYKELGKVPTINEFAIESKFSPEVYKKRFQNWRNVVGHYLGPEAQKASAVRQKRAEPARPTLTSPAVTTSERTGGRSGRVFGPPLNFRELRHEPVNEQGVVFLFGMVARELGFLVDAVGTGFPDCRAKRRNRSGYYVEVDIEFEFRSSNFREHGHDPRGCDLVVCWEHDWTDCVVEVLELKSAISQLDAYA